MFEAPQEKSKSSMGLWIAIAVGLAAAAIGAFFLVTSKGHGNKPASVAASAPAQAQAQAKGSPDPVHDLRVQRATMSKDRNGTMAVWLVTIENRSATYSYTKIKYETTYVGADNNAILINQGTIAATIGPGEQTNSQINDALYPAGTAWYKFRVTGATPSAQ